MNTLEYENKIKEIDNKLKRGSFEFSYLDFKEENNVFTGKKVNEFWKRAIAVKREEQFIIDNNGISHSILSDKIRL